MFVFGVILIFAMLFLGFPLYLALGFGAVLVCIYYGGIPLIAVSSFFFNYIYSFTILAIPLFILAGYIMVESGTAGHLVNFIDAWIGRVRGGLAAAMIFACTFFGAMSGSSFACAAAIGTIMMPSFNKAGYKPSFPAGILSCSSSLGSLIPPSITLIVIGVLIEQSVAVLFMATLIPGIVTAVLMAIMAIIIYRVKGYHSSKEEVVSLKMRLTTTARALPALFTPVIILGGIYSGIFTPTESAAIAVVYTVFIGFIVYRKLTIVAFWKSVTTSVRLSGMIFLLLAAAMVMGQAFILGNVPQIITRSILSFNMSPLMFYLLCGIVLLVLGCVMDITALIYVVVPMILPTALELGIDTVQLSIFILMAAMVATVTPPVGIALFFVSSITNVPFKSVMSESLPFLGVMVLVWLLIALIPELSLWLPSIFT